MLYSAIGVPHIEIEPTLSPLGGCELSKDSDDVKDELIFEFADLPHDASELTKIDKMDIIKTILLK